MINELKPENCLNDNVPQLHVFVDENGTNELDSDKKSVSHLFICTAVIIKDQDIKLVNSAMIDISSNLCSGAEISSKRIGKDHKRRLKFLSGIKDLPFEYYSLIINKDRIDKDSGYQYKRTFYKSINAMLYRKLSTLIGTKLRVMADAIGGQEFRDSFKDYFEKKDIPNLFFGWQFSFENSTDIPAIQLADLISGTLSYCFDKEKKGEFSTQFREILRQREIGYDFWPYGNDEKPEITTNSEDKLNEILEKNFRYKAFQFINNNEDSYDDGISGSNFSFCVFIV